MSQKTINLIDITYEAEGEPDKRELLEPSSPLKTASVPAIRDLLSASSSDTGLNFMVQLKKDGQDNADEQDASLTKDETKLKTEKNATQNPITAQSTSPILIVEDSVELAEVIQATLEGMSIESVHETHGKNGIKRLQEFAPQLVIMDISLPDITGWKMLDHIKEHYHDRDTEIPPIIVISAYGDPANRLIGKLQNVHSYLIKPFTPDQVEKMVLMALNGETPHDPAIGGEPSATN